MLNMEGNMYKKSWDVNAGNKPNASIAQTFVKEVVV
jgi:hypothetical protein